jgi:hypothetical protein
MGLMEHISALQAPVTSRDVYGRSDSILLYLQLSSLMSPEPIGE